MGILGALLVAVTVQAGPVDVKTEPVFNPSVCAKKRVDACGCHHVYGVRHCHANRKTPHCEATAQVTQPGASRVDDFLSSLNGGSDASEQAQQDSVTL